MICNAAVGLELVNKAAAVRCGVVIVPPPSFLVFVVFVSSLDACILLRRLLILLSSCLDFFSVFLEEEAAGVCMDVLLPNAEPALLLF